MKDPFVAMHAAWDHTVKIFIKIQTKPGIHPQKWLKNRLIKVTKSTFCNLI